MTTSFPTTPYISLELSRVVQHCIVFWRSDSGEEHVGFAIGGVDAGLT